MTMTLRKWLLPILIFVFLILIQVIFVVSYIKLDLTRNNDYLIFTCMGAMTFSAVIYVLFVRYIAVSDGVYEKEKEEELNANMKHLDEKYYAIVESELYESRKVRENLLEHINQLKEHHGSIEEIDEDLGKIRQLRYCEEPTANMVLTLKKNRAEKEYIPMSIKAVIPSDINISKLDLSSAISNMVDNAIEAAILVKESTVSIGLEPYVNVNVAIIGDFFVVRTENPTLSDKTIDDIDDLHTTKDSGYGVHGYGIKILHSISERYGGELTVDIKDHVSVITMMMNCNGKDFQL